MSLIGRKAAHTVYPDMTVEFLTEPSLNDAGFFVVTLVLESNKESDIGRLCQHGVTELKLLSLE